ncbi:unnamed protein product [Closterium sp. NIES-64]|nr:unnamed protein product [Closterium sp. NIES-64]
MRRPLTPVPAPCAARPVRRGPCTARPGPSPLVSARRRPTRPVRRVSRPVAARPVAARTGPSPPFAASRAALPYLRTRRLTRRPRHPTSGPAASLSAPPPHSAAPQPHSAAPQPHSAAPQPHSAAPQPHSAAPPPYMRPRRLALGPVTCCSAARHPSRPSRLTRPSSRLTRRPLAAQPSRPAAEQPSRQAAEPPSSRAAQQPRRPPAEPPSSGAAEPPSRRAAEPPSRRAALLPGRPTCPVCVLAFDAEGRAIDFEVWVDDQQLFLQCDRADGLSLFDLTSGASPAPAADADATVRSQWATRDATARLAVRRHLPTSERAHFSQYKSAQTLYDAVVARYSSPATAALSRLMLPYLFPNLAAFPTVADLITHLRTSDTRYRAALPPDFCAKNPPPHVHHSLLHSHLPP